MQQEAPLTLSSPPVFKDFPEEGNLIGGLILRYAEFEFILSSCVGLALSDSNAAMRMMFRLRSEYQKLEVCDAVSRPKYRAWNLEAEWSNMFAAIQRCQQIRNQYAHCLFFGSKEEGLCFCVLDQVVRSRNGKLLMDLEKIDLDLLHKQADYFSYTEDWIWFVEHEASKKLGVPGTASIKPTLRELVPLSNGKKES